MSTSIRSFWSAFDATSTTFLLCIFYNDDDDDIYELDAGKTWRARSILEGHSLVFILLLGTEDKQMHSRKRRSLLGQSLPVMLAGPVYFPFPRPTHTSCKYKCSP